MASTTDRDSFALTDPYHPLRVRAIFSQKAQDDIEGRYTICLAVRDKLLRNTATQPQCFQAYHTLMQEESIKYRNLIQHVTSGQVYEDNQLEYETWCHWNAKVTGRNPRKPPPPPTDQQWVHDVLGETKTWLSSVPPRAPGSDIWPTWQQYHAEQIAAFLEFGSPPNKDDAVKVYYCGSEDGANLIDSGALLVIENIDV